MSSGEKYLKTPKGLKGDGKMDVYAVLLTFGVTCPAIQHAIKKLLFAGERGKGDRRQDLEEAIDTIRRGVEIQDSIDYGELREKVIENNPDKFNDNDTIWEPVEGKREAAKVDWDKILEDTSKPVSDDSTQNDAKESVEEESDPEWDWHNGTGKKFKIPDGQVWEIKYGGTSRIESTRQTLSYYKENKYRRIR